MANPENPDGIFEEAAHRIGVTSAVFGQLIERAIEAQRAGNEGVSLTADPPNAELLIRGDTTEAWHTRRDAQVARAELPTRYALQLLVQSEQGPHADS